MRSYVHKGQDQHYRAQMNAEIYIIHTDFFFSQFPR